MSKSDDAAALVGEPLAVSVPKAAALLGISKNGAYEMAAAGILPCVRIGCGSRGRILVPMKGLRELLENLHRKPPQQAA